MCSRSFVERPSACSGHGERRAAAAVAHDDERCGPTRADGDQIAEHPGPERPGAAEQRGDQDGDCRFQGQQITQHGPLGPHRQQDRDDVQRRHLAVRYDQAPVKKTTATPRLASASRFRVEGSVVTERLARCLNIPGRPG
jgi:hypothetical protein